MTRFAVVSVTAVAWALGFGIAYYTPSVYGAVAGVVVGLVGTGIALTTVELPEQAEL